MRKFHCQAEQKLFTGTWGIQEYLEGNKLFRIPQFQVFKKSEHYIEVDFNIESIWSIQTLM